MFEIGMLLERENVLAALDGLAADAVGGSGKIAFVTGEAGIGKTSVLRAFASRLPDGMRALWTAFEDISPPEALTLLRDLRNDEGGRLALDYDSGSRLELFRDVVDVLVAAPTVLFVDDLHWADDGSIDFLRYVGRRIVDYPLLLIVTSRNENQVARARLIRASSDLPPVSRCRFDLDRLSSAAVGELAAGKGRIGARIHLLSDGNPLLVTELLASEDARSESIDELVVDRANQLPSGARSFLDHCSIIPRRIALDQIESAEPSDEDLRICLESGLLVQEGDELAFRHELTRRAIEAALSPIKRKRLHAAELARLDRINASAARRLHHAIQSGNDAQVTELAPIAAEEASRLGAHRAALDALRALLGINDPPRDPELFRQYSFELHVVGDLKQAINWQGRALKIYQERDQKLAQGNCLGFLSILHYMDGNRTLSERAGLDAIRVLEPLGETAELAHAYTAMAGIAMLADDAPRVAELCEPAIPIARKFGRRDILARALNNLGSSLQFINLEQCLALIDESIDTAKSAGVHQQVAPAYINKAWALMMNHRIPEAIAVFEEGIEYCLDHDLDNWRPYSEGAIAMCLVHLGRWDEAAAAAAPVIADRDKGPVARNPALRAQTAIAIRRGEEFAHLLDELRNHMTTGRESPRFTPLALIEAEAAWTYGKGVAAAIAILREAIALLPPHSNPWERGTLWFWCRKLGENCEALTDLPNAFTCFGSGDIAAAATAMHARQLPFEEALMLVEGKEEQAARGLAILDQLGATETAARVRNDLLERGIRRGTRGPRPATRKNRFGLTQRELDVLAQICKGLSNKEIAKQLFLSPKTVDHHVSSILAKTETRSRGEVAALARSEALIE